LKIKLHESKIKLHQVKTKRQAGLLGYWDLYKEEEQRMERKLSTGENGARQQTCPGMVEAATGGGGWGSGHRFRCALRLGWRPWTSGGGSSSTAFGMDGGGGYSILCPPRSIFGFSRRREEGGGDLQGEDGVVAAAVVHRVLLRRRWPADGGVGACSSDSGSKVVVLGFFFCEDEDLPDVDPFSSSQSVEFRKAPTANGTSHLLPGVCWIGWYSVASTHAFIPTVWFWRERREALFCVDTK
jgi:hypothetical protein